MVLKSQSTSQMYLLPSLSLSIEEAIIANGLIKINCENGKCIQVYPHRLVYLENKLCLIVEECTDNVILHFPLYKIASIELVNGLHYRAKFTQVEINDYLSAIRAMNGRGYRLVIKVAPGKHVNFSPKYHYFEKSYSVLNQDGEMIWAAYVEISNYLFQWLFEIDDSILILTPDYIKRKYEDFYQEKMTMATNKLNKLL